MNNNIAGVDALREYVVKDKLKRLGDQMFLVGVATLVSSLALAVLGIAAIATLNFPAATIFITLASSSFFLSCNSILLSDNLLEISKNPRKFIDNDSKIIMSKELKNALGKGTVGVQWLIDIAVDKAAR